MTAPCSCHLGPSIATLAVCLDMLCSWPCNSPGKGFSAPGKCVLVTGPGGGVLMGSPLVLVGDGPLQKRLYLG